MAQRVIDTQPIQDRIDALKALLKNPYPTPPVGTPVVWYPRAEQKEGNEVAALVTKIEGSGKVIVTTFRPHSVPEHKAGVLHVSNPIHEVRANAASRNCGSWDYPVGSKVKVPLAHYQHHKDELARLIESAENQLEEALAIKEKDSKDSKDAAKAKKPELATA